MPLILYTTLGTADMARSARFYDAVLAPLGFAQNPGTAEDWTAYGAPSYDAGVSLQICLPFDGQPPSPGNGAMTAFEAKSPAEVRAFYTAALAHGGTDEGAPGIRAMYSPDFYVAYVRDPDGNKLACVFHHYDAAKDI